MKILFPPILVPLVTAFFLYAPTAGAASFGQKLQELGELKFDASISYNTKFRKACKTSPRFNSTKREIAALTDARTVNEVFAFKTFMQSSRRNRLCANALLEDQGLFVTTMELFEAAGCETNSLWGRAKCFNTGSCPAAVGTISWSAAHERATSSEQSQCVEYQYSSEDEWRANVK